MSTLPMAVGFDRPADAMQIVPARPTKGSRRSSARASADAWMSKMFDSTVCCVALLLLSPAIVAVWIAIRRTSTFRARSIV